VNQRYVFMVVRRDPRYVKSLSGIPQVQTEFL
jgi:hypothetical protein